MSPDASVLPREKANLNERTIEGFIFEFMERKK